MAAVLAFIGLRVSDGNWEIRITPVMQAILVSHETIMCITSASRSSLHMIRSPNACDGHHKLTLRAMLLISKFRFLLYLQFVHNRSNSHCARYLLAIHKS